MKQSGHILFSNQDNWKNNNLSGLIAAYFTIIRLATSSATFWVILEKLKKFRMFQQTIHE